VAYFYRLDEPRTKMPFYEFYCPENHTIYTFFARSMRLAGMTPRCPANPSYSLRRVASRFSVTKGMPDSDSDATADEAFEDPALERAFSALEGKFAHLDPDNPDPRELGHLMREMTSLAGETMAPEMEEVIGRLEKGEDPDKLEEEFGDVIDSALGDEADPSGDAPTETRLRRRLRRVARPRRNETVFPMEDYLD